MTAYRLPALALSLLLAFVTAALGAMASIDAKGFYANLVQPAWAPPPWLFGPVWTLLYLMMALALWRYWLSPARRWPGTVLYLAQLLANGLWSWLFFQWHWGLGALLEMLVLLALIIATIRAFARADRLAAALLVPYLAWVAFATALTFSLWQANGALLG